MAQNLGKKLTLTTKESNMYTFKVIGFRIQRVETYVTVSDTDEIFDKAVEQDDWTVLDTGDVEDIDFFFQVEDKDEFL
jgi:hypothetical protein